MGEEQELEEFYEDFGAQPLSTRELEAILERARITSDVELRRLLKEVQVLRWLVPILPERVEKTEGISDEPDEALKLAHYIVRGHGS
jgi:hypothetical protein